MYSILPVDDIMTVDMFKCKYDLCSIVACLVLSEPFLFDKKVEEFPSWTVLKYKEELAFILERIVEFANELIVQPHQYIPFSYYVFILFLSVFYIILIFLFYHFHCKYPPVVFFLY